MNFTRYIYRAKLKDSNLSDAWVYGAYLKFLPYTPQPVSSKHIPESDYKHLIITEAFQTGVYLVPLNLMK